MTGTRHSLTGQTRSSKAHGVVLDPDWKNGVKTPYLQY